MQIGTHIGIPGLGASPSPGPYLDLDASAGGRNFSSTFVRGGSAATLSDTDAAITDPEGNDIDEMTVVVGGAQDGANEVLTIGADTFPLNANKSTTEVAGATTFALAYVTATQTVTITNNAGGAMPVADLVTLVESMTHEVSGTPTYGNRTFTFTLTANSLSGPTAVATVSVVDQAPVIDAIADTTATVGVEKTITPNNSGGPATSWSATGLSDGASINTSTGVVSWTPTIETTINITITATNSGGSDDEAVEVVSSAVPAIPTDAMEAWYRLDEGTGTAIADSSGNGYSGTLASATGSWDNTTIDGTPMLTCKTSGGSNYATTTAPFINGSFSVVAVAMFRGVNITRMIANHRDSGSPYTGWFLRRTNTNTIEFGVDGGATLVTCSLEAIHLESPVILIATYDDVTGNISLHMNDGRSDTNTGAGVAAPISSSFQIGIDATNPSNKFDGRLSDVMYYSRVLSMQDRADIIGNLWNKYFGSFSPSVTETDSQLTVTKTALPNDGSTVENTPSLYAPLFATANYWYASLPENTGSDNTILYQLSKDDYTANASANINAVTYDSLFGHRGSAVCVTDNGRVLVHPHGHQADGWLGEHSTNTSEDISAFSATPNPNSLTAVSYFRMCKNPVSGDVFFMVRNQDLDTELYKWNDGTTSWDVVKAPLTQYRGGSASAYDAWITFDGSGNLYLCTQSNQAGAGYPRCFIGVAKSTDAGENWTNLEGTAITTPIKEGTQSTAFPLSASVGGAESDHDAEGCISLVTSGGDVLVFGGYRDATRGDTYRKLYMARWDSTGKYFTRHVLADVGVDHGAFNGKTAWYYSGTIYLLYTETDFHELTNYPGGPYPDPGHTYLLISSDDGDTWTRYIVDDGTGTFKCYESYGCPTSLAEDGVIRIMPCLLDSFDTSDNACEVWEVTPPSP